MSATICQLQTFLHDNGIRANDYVVGGSMAMYLLGYPVIPDDIDLQISDPQLERLIIRKALYVKNSKIVNEYYKIDCGYVNPHQNCIFWSHEDCRKFSQTTNNLVHLSKEGLIWFYMDICKIKGFNTKWGEKLKMLREYTKCDFTNVFK